MRTALVTGANRGIGLAIVTALAARGDTRVLLGCRDLRLGIEAAAGLPAKVEAVHVDLGERTRLKEQVGALQADHGPIDVLVNNAGILLRGGVLDGAEGDFDESMRVNVLAAYDLLRLVVPGMLDRGYGRIVNMSSGLGAFSEGLGGPAAYSVSKAALNALTVVLARELRGDVKVNAMCPGWVKTRMGGESAPRTPEAGADTAVWLATLPPDGPSGGFFRDRRAIAW